MLFVDSNDIDLSFNERIQTIPLIDDKGHLVAVAEKRNTFLNINGRIISEDDPSYIIAEIGINHQGSIELAKRLVDAAVDAKVDCVKFQMRNLTNLYKNKGNSSDASSDLGAQYTLDILNKYQLSDDELFEVFKYCEMKGITPLCTPWDIDSLESLERYGMSAYKVASADCTNFELLDAIIKTKKPIICSTGMSTEREIAETIEFLRRKKANFALLHCNSTYPTPFKDVNLSYLSRLKSISNTIVGYSGHERGWWVCTAALALGAKIIEKHITVDKGLEGNDHKVSLLPNEFKTMVEQIRQVEESIGSNSPRELSQGEMINREVLAKSLMASHDIDIGQTITKDMISIMSPGQGLQPNRIEELIGRKSIRKMSAGDVFFETDINGNYSKKSNYVFTRPYGIPVRYHDFISLSSGVDLDFVEFHLSYKDMEVDIASYVEKNQKIKFAVHSPDLFAGDHIMDLADDDDNHVDRSIYELNRVINVTRKLKGYFPKTSKPVIVVNAGGWDTKGFINKDDRSKKYARVYESISSIDSSGVEIAIQTMPPFPWHFGGQSYCNLFTDADETVAFCEKAKVKLCLDVSHTMMTCNFYGGDLYEYIKKIAPYVVHMHIVDAKGVDGEGVQIGTGDVDFKKLKECLNKYAPGVQFLPEIWQGHTNQGEGFWSALSFLECEGF